MRKPTHADNGTRSSNYPPCQAKLTSLCRQLSAGSTSLGLAVAKLVLKTTSSCKQQGGLARYRSVPKHAETQQVPLGGVGSPSTATQLPALANSQAYYLLANINAEWHMPPQLPRPELLCRATTARHALLRLANCSLSGRSWTAHFLDQHYPHGF